MVLAIMEQMAAFALMLTIGFLCARARIVTAESLPSAISLSTKVFLPAMLFSVVCERVTKDLVIEHLPIVVLAALLYALAIGVTKLLSTALHLKGSVSAAFRMVFVFGNTGFIGLPVLVAVFPETGAINLILFMLVDQVVFWTYGITLARAEARPPDWRSMLKGILNPNIAAIALALGCLLADARMSDVAVGFLETIGAAATPLCMICLGALCYYAHPRRILVKRELYVGTIVKMVALPLALAPLLEMLPLPADISLSMVLMAGMPPTVLVPLVVEANKGAASYATSLSVVTIVFSVITLPMVSHLAGM